MRLLSASLVLVSVIGPLAFVPSSAHACLPDTTYEPFRDAEVIVLGRVTGETVNADSYFTSTAWTFQTDAVIKGDAPETMRLWREYPALVGKIGCEANIATGGMYLVAFPSAFGSAYWNVPSESGVIRVDDRMPLASLVESIASRLDEQAALQEASEDEATEDTPWLIVLPLAFAIPLAFLLIPAFLSKRTPGH